VDVTASNDGNRLPEWFRLVLKQVEGLRFGVVQIIVHDGQVTQIERTERVRLTKPVVTYEI
jgi:hypothetical protein